LTLIVNPPRAAPGYDSTRLLYQRQPSQLAHFAHNEWVDTPAHMLAPLLVAALQRGGPWQAVVAAPSVASGDLRLETMLLRLHQDFSQARGNGHDNSPDSAPSQVRFTLRATLVDSASHRVLAWREFDTTEPAPGNDPDSGVAAANRAVQRVLVDLAGFCEDAARHGAAP
jgi:cholesterol transport system auxiliary component